MSGQSISKPPLYTLPIIIFSQFAGTSLWFASNAILPELQSAIGLGPSALGPVTSSVQFGFIAGTLIFAIMSIADRFSPSKVFLACAIAGAAANLSILLWAKGLGALLTLRFLTGFFLAGIYPVGMKIAADWYGKGLGKALGYLVGALVLGTAFPHILRTLAQGMPWEAILWATSCIAVLGGVVLAWTVGDGPYRAPSPKFSWKAIPKIFAFKAFRGAAMGYFGHMWELYAFWAFVPVMLAAYQSLHPGTSFLVSAWSGGIIAAGALGCVFGGYWSVRHGSARIAMLMLVISCVCCILSFWAFYFPLPLFLLFMGIWGFAVVGDSPQFSAIVAQTAPKAYIGTALTIVNSIGFTVTIFSIQLLGYTAGQLPPRLSYIALCVGPILGIWAIAKLAWQKNGHQG